MPDLNFMSVNEPPVVLDTSVARQPRLVVDVPPERVESVRKALESLLQMAPAMSAQSVLLDALQAAAEQTYFWSPAWQAKERQADLAIAEGRIQEFESMDDMLDFLDAQ